MGSIMNDAWPVQPSPRWPSRCLIENVAVHPDRPWLAVACTDAENQRGAVLVFDAQAGPRGPLRGLCGVASVLRVGRDEQRTQAG